MTVCNSILSLLLLVCILSLSHTLKCKICHSDDPFCVESLDDNVQECPNGEDLCYSWLNRMVYVSAQRGCMSSTSAEYLLINEMLDGRSGGCVKVMRRIDCFEFCSDDSCN